MRGAVQFSIERGSRRMNRHREKRNISFLTKVRLSYGVLIMIPVLVLEIFVLNSSISFIKEQQSIQARETIERNYQDIENQMAICDRSLMYLISNNTLKDFMETTDDEYRKRALSATNVSTLLYNAWLSNQYFSKIEIYTEKKFAVINALFKNIDEYEDKNWYKVTMESEGTIWWYEDGKYVMTRRILSNLPEKKLGVIRIEVKKDIFLNGVSMFADIPVNIQVADSEGLVYEYNNGKNTGNIGMSEQKKLSCSDWEIHYMVDKMYFSNFRHPKIILSFVIVIVLLAAGLAAINISTKGLLKNLFQIMNDVKKVKEDNFEIQVDDSSEDELGDLAKSINQMLRKIQLLINEVYKSKIEQKNLELNLLQSKINPHFLYNNLSAINWIAIENGEDRIYEITTQLATFYRTALNKGVNVDKVRVEVDNIRAYIQLQLISHENSFDVEYEVDEKLLDKKTPIFIMQPLVENAIEHGIDTLRDEKGKLKICVQETENVLLIEIKDNGRELFEKIGASILDESGYGYGVNNVHRRIQLLCGDNYGVTIRANELGTTSSIRIRKDFIAFDVKS